ncbi:unnamed protein product [Paramecium sonneborni]|uniref:Polyadenylate-binding protein n=1 Tax=Paramecium sonneborni TaxID=65129 RepID=A0A8S1QCT0_9CILI|nr:unnamed protein product [Paramecium sonneborni]
MQNAKISMPIEQKVQFSKNTIFLLNLDKGITEDYLFHQFKQFGDIDRIKIKKDKHTNKSYGQALITFSDASSANKARLTLDNQKLINNIIRIKPYFNKNDAEKNANIFMKNLPNSAKAEELEIEFSKYGNILSIEIRRDQQGNYLNYGYVQFQQKAEAKLFLEQMNKSLFYYQGNQIQFELFKSPQERTKESNELYLRGFSQPIPQNLFQNEKVIIAIEYGWQLIIKDYFSKLQNTYFQDCYVKIDKNTRQPWAMIQFELPEKAKENYNICENTRIHPCIQSNIHNAIQLIKENHQKLGNISDIQLSLQEIISIYELIADNKIDIFSGASENFYFNLKQNIQQNFEERQLYVQNINGYINENDMKEFLSQFGIIISLIMKQSKKKFSKLQDCIVLYQTVNDARCALSQIYDRSNSQKANHIFKNGLIKICVFLSKNLREEYLQIKKKKLLYRPMIQNQFIPELQKPHNYDRQNQSKLQQVVPNIQTQIQKFHSIDIVKAQMQNFLSLSESDQRNILGALLFHEVLKVVKDQNTIRHIVGMIIDPTQFEISDIFDLFDNDEELQEIIQQGLQLVKDHQN